MGQLPDWIGNFPFPPDKKKPIVITRSQTKQFIYPDKPENSDFNWNYASTDKFFIAQYQLSPGVQFLPADVHTGDEVYYVVEGTLTMFNPETGEVHQVEENECFFIPLGGWHQGYNFTNKQTRMFLIIAPKIWPPKGLPEEGFPGETRIFSFNRQLNPNPKTQRVDLHEGPRSPDLIGRWPIAGPLARKEPVNSMLISEKDKLSVIWGDKYPVLLKFLVSNDLVHMAEFFLPSGGLSPRCSEAHAHQGDDLAAKIESFKGMIDRAKEAYPGTRVFGTTLREVISTNAHMWGAIAAVGDEWHVVEPREIVVLDRIGGGDGFVGGMLYAMLRGWEPKKWIQFGWATGALATTQLTDYAQPADEEQVWSIWAGNARVQR